MDGQPPLTGQSALADLSLTYGVTEVGILITMFLTGVETIQVWHYYRNYATDPKTIQSMVGIVYVMDILNMATLIHSMYHYTILNFGVFANLGDVVWSLYVATAAGGVVTFTVQTFFCMRIYRITSWIPAVACWILAVTRIILISLFIRNLADAGNFGAIQTDQTLRAFSLGTFIVGAVSDVLIAGFVCIGLLRARTGSSSTNKLVNKLIAVTIGSGLLTSVVAVCDVVTFVVMDNFVHLAFLTILPKLFSNSMLASLNERMYTRRDLFNKPHDFRSKESSLPKQHVIFQRTTVVTSESEGAIELEAVDEAQYKGAFFNDSDNSRAL